MATVKRRGQFRQHEPYATRDLNWYMDWKIDGYIQYLDEIDPVGIYTLEYDTDIPTKGELLNSIDQNHIQISNTRPKAVDKEEEKDNKEWFFEGEIVLQDEEEINPFDYAEEIFLGQEKRDKEELEKRLNEREKRKQELKAKRRQEEKEARERRIERKKANEERENLKREKENHKHEKEKIRRTDRAYVDRYFQNFGREGLYVLYHDAVGKIADLKLIIDASDVEIQADIDLLKAYKYRIKYVSKLIEQEHQKLNKE